MSQPILVWFRQDLRLDDNMALAAALSAANDTGAPIIPLFIDDTELPRQPGEMALWWRNKALAVLDKNLQARQSRLTLRSGDAAGELSKLIDETNARAVYWSRQYDAPSIARDKQIKEQLREASIEAESMNSLLLVEPWEVKSKTGGTNFKVFSPFWRACQAQGIDDSVWDAPKTLPAPASWPETEVLPEAIAPTGTTELTQWEAGEDGALKALQLFLDENGHGYAQDRDFPCKPASSRLSPHLRWGEISPRRIFAKTRQNEMNDKDRNKFLAELGWREFSYQILFHNPQLETKGLQAKFDAFPWREGADADADFEAWKAGQTGYPIVDAGMRELRQTGFMHNRVRMVAASFLIKHLLIDWRRGEQWFWQCLADADPANNTASWQWVAGCGADAAPYFRIFNPIIQGLKFDPEGDYTKGFVPEISGLTGKLVFAPWEASPEQLNAAGIALGTDYPAPLVKHEMARERALEIFKSLE